MVMTWPPKRFMKAIAETAKNTSVVQKESTDKSSWTYRHSSVHSYIECDNVLPLPVTTNLTNTQMERICFRE